MNEEAGRGRGKRGIGSLSGKVLVWIVENTTSTMWQHSLCGMGPLVSGTSHAWVFSRTSFSSLGNWMRNETEHSQGKWKPWVLPGPITM